MFELELIFFVYQKILMGKRRRQVQPPPDSEVWENQTQFRILERKIKRKGPIDSGLLEELPPPYATISLWGNEKKVLKFEQFEGFYLIKNAIPPSIQKEMVELALTEWVRPPNVNNLDSHFELNSAGIWNEFVQWKSDSSNCSEPSIKRRLFENVSPIRYGSNEEKKQAVVSVYDPKTNLMIDSPVDHMLKNDDVPVSKVLNRLRWATLGHQYNWSKKEYHFDRVPPFPERLWQVSQDIVDATKSITGYDPSLWKPEAGIVNFYQPGDSLTAHQDKSEVNSVAPLLSISIGLDCIFLMGTEDRAEKPIALRLESGDLVIMSGPSRRSFHGVPRVIPDSLPSYLAEDWGHFGDHLSHTRVNINIRQVF